MTESNRVYMKRLRAEQKMDFERKWHESFAWFPLLSEDGYWAWLETVYRCRRHRYEPWRYLVDVHNIMTVTDER